ncbi:AraC family transcriptional regulator [Thiolapillus sp.]
MPLSLYSPMLDLTFQTARSYGVDTDLLMKEYGIDAKLVTDPNARFRMEQIDALYDRIAELIDDPNFGLKAVQFWHPSQMGALGYAWLTSDTLRAAFKRYARFSKVVSDAVRLEIKETDDELSLDFHYLQKQSSQKFRIDGALATLMAMTRANAGSDFHPKAVSFTFEEPEDTGPYYALFQSPVSFNSPTNRFTITLEEADAPRSCSNIHLAQLHDQFMLEYVAQLDKENIIERVKVAITEELASGNISDALIAKKLFLTERTLQRRLQENGTTFKKLLTEVRIDLADNYIRDSKLSLNEISFLLGFSELSSFSRAFKNWTGSSPRNYRQEKRGEKRL